MIGCDAQLMLRALPGIPIVGLEPSKHGAMFTGCCNRSMFDQPP
jgi:hypothetical protein